MRAEQLSSVTLAGRSSAPQLQGPGFKQASTRPSLFNHACLPACPGFPAYLAPVAVELDSEGHIAIIEEAVVDVHTAVATPNDLARAIDSGLEHTSAHISALRYVWSYR